VGLQGRFEDAKQISGSKQNPSTLDANMVYLREMISQPHRWKDLKKMDKKKT
jgi:Flp pilus assembly protein TadD